jgi:hypothetical protein
LVHTVHARHDVDDEHNALLMDQHRRYRSRGRTLPARLHANEALGLAGKVGHLGLSETLLVGMRQSERGRADQGRRRRQARSLTNKLCKLVVTLGNESEGVMYNGDGSVSQDVDRLRRLLRLAVPAIGT